MNTNHNSNITRLCFYSLWLVVSLIQAYSTGLLADEAYYWKYAQHLSWGYFDHPPVVAALIKPGYALLQSELGVRLLTVLMGTAFIYLLELLTRPKKLLLFYLTIMSVGAFHFLTYLALPDMPLLFFSALFLYLYKTYLQKDNWPIAVLLAITTTLLLLSKYHGILIVVFALLPNLSLLKRPSFWIIVALSTLAFLPHVYWQFAHNFPSIKYHLSERSAGSYNVEYTLGYLGSVILMFSPLAGIVLAWHSLKAKPHHSFDKTLKWILAGTLLFFLGMTFKGRTEANWVAITLIPAIVYGYRICEGKSWYASFIRYTAAGSLLLITALRVYLVYDYLPDVPQLAYARETLHGTEKWARQLQEKAGERPVVFMNKYQHAAWYEFYTGNLSISLNNRMGRKNQYNIWNDEFEIQGKNVMLVPNYSINGLDTIETAKGLFQYQYIDNFRSASNITISPLVKDTTADSGTYINIPFTISTTGNSKYDLEANANMQPVLHAVIFKSDNLYGDNSTEFYIRNNMLAGNTYSVNVKAPAEAGTYTLYLDVTVGGLPPAINSSKITLVVK